MSRPTVAQGVAQAVTSVRAETIRGRVLGDGGNAIVGATVIATMAPDRLSQQVTTDGDGRFELQFEHGTGDYLVYSIAPGFRAFRRRVAFAPASSIYNVDVQLTADSSGQQLNAVRVAARRPRLVPDMVAQPDPAAVESLIGGVPSTLPPDQYGNLIAMAATVPGISIGPDGSLVIGGLSGQVSTTLNGMAMSVTDIPADVGARVRVSSSSWDPAVGGFGGARVNVEIANYGSPLTSSTFGHLFLDAPPLQYTDAASSQLGGRVTRLDMGAASAGPLVDNKWYYNGGFTVRRTASDVPTFLNASPSVLALLGLSPDSAARARQILAGLGVPLFAPGVAIQHVTDGVSMLGWIGYLPRTIGGARNTGALRSPTNFFFTGSLSANQSRGSGSLAATPASGNANSAVNGQLTASIFRNFANSALTEAQTSFGFSSARSTPYLTIPSGVVRVESTLPDGSAAISTLGIGGSSSQRASDYASWETTSTTQFYITNQHRIKVFAESHLEWFTQSSSSNTLGTYAFNSLVDLEAGRAVTYSRSLVSPSATGSELSGAVGLGDAWQISPALRLEYSARLDGNHFGNAPDFNPVLAQQFGVSTAHVPNTLGVEPRVGFAWLYGTTAAQNPPVQSPYAQLSVPPRGALSGGVGEFRNVLSPMIVSGAMTNTGLATGAERLLCIGAAVPSPAWSTSSNSGFPARCESSASSTLTDAAPNVQLLDPTFTAPRTWRGVLQWSSAVRWIRYSLNATYAINLDQADARDLNFAGKPQFTLGNEANRPVFVPVTNFDAASGAVTSTGARHTGAYASVLDLSSDLRSTSRSLTLVAVPDIRASRALVSLAYTLGDVRDQTRGFSGASTFGSPLELQSGRSSFDIRHTISLQAGYPISSILFLNAFLFVRSGVPYTPLISGDVNGDGLSNDRAFIFDPARVSDTAMANGMRALLASAPSQARSCLLRQLGAPAARNSCDGPWTATLNASIVSKTYRVADGRRLHYTVAFTNVFGGLDELLHGSSLQGWGAPAQPNPYLYFLRGFDPALRQFQYDVNPRFGDTRPSQSVVRAPFRVTLQFAIELGAPAERQTVARIMNPGRAGRPGVRIPADSVRAIYQQSIGDIYQELSRERDSLLLTALQVAALEKHHKHYLARTDSLWAAFGAWVGTLGDTYSATEVIRSVDAMAEKNAAIARDELPSIRAVLTALQLSLVYGGVGDMLHGLSQRPFRAEVRR